MGSTQHRREADAARSAMLANANRLKQRLSPSTLMNDAAQNAQQKALAVTEQAVETARARPALAGSIAGGILLLLARKPLGRLFCRKRAERPDPEITDLELAEGHPS